MYQIHFQAYKVKSSKSMIFNDCRIITLFIQHYLLSCFLTTGHFWAPRFKLLIWFGWVSSLPIINTSDASQQGKNFQVPQPCEGFKIPVKKTFKNLLASSSFRAHDTNV